jgi:hypothetical protein
MITMDEIRAKYPTPHRAGGIHFPEDGSYPEGDSYCVGGALCRLIGINRGFPFIHEIKAALRLCNEHLTNEEAYKFANEIAKLNDSGFFSLAWLVLREALTFGQQAPESDVTEDKELVLA